MREGSRPKPYTTLTFIYESAVQISYSYWNTIDLISTEAVFFFFFFSVIECMIYQ